MKKKNRRTRGLAGLLVALMLVSNLSLPTAAVELPDPTPDLSVEEAVQDVGESTEESVGEPAEEPTEEPGEDPTEEPADKPAEAPGEELTEEPAAEEPTEEPGEELAEESVEEFAEEPLEEELPLQNGTGTEKDPYQISTAEELAALAKRVNDEENPQTYEGQFFKLTEDIDLTDYLSESGAGWEPIGGDNGPFKGTFDGKGHVISGLWIKRPDWAFIGLFGHTNNGSFQNIKLELDEKGIVGGGYVGGLIGIQIVTEGTSAIVENCSVTGGKMSVRDSEEDSTIVGGLIGEVEVYGEFTIQNCHATVEVAGMYFAGGLVGRCPLYERGNCTVQNSYATGEVTGMYSSGGLFGGCGGDGKCTIQNSYATGRTTGIDFIGGLVGILSTEYGTDSILIEKCYATGAVKANAFPDEPDPNFSVGGLVGVAVTGEGDITLKDSLCLAKEMTTEDAMDVGRVLGNIYTWGARRRK